MSRVAERDRTDAEERAGDDRPEQKAEDRSDEQNGDGGPAWLDLKFTLAGGAVVALTLFLAVFSVGAAGSAEARAMLEFALPSVRFLCSSLLTVGATVLALMLTLLGFTQTESLQFRPVHYRRIRQISLMNVIAIVTAVCLLLFMELPLAEADALRSMYQIIYYGFLALSSLLGGLAVAIVLMLHRTILGLSHAVSPGGGSSGLVRVPD